MKKIMVLLTAVFMFAGLFGQSAERNAKYSEDAIDYMNENGIEYEIMPDAPIKVLPKGAQILTSNYVQSFVTDFEIAAASPMALTFNLIESYGYADHENRPKYRRLVFAGGNDLGGDGYLYKWETNTTNNQSSPGWTSITRQYACPGGSTSSTIVSYCDQQNPNIRVIAYPTNEFDGESGYSADYNEYTACKRCKGDLTPTVASFLFSVKTYVYSWQQIYIFGVGWVWQRIRIFSPNWVSTYSSGAQYFNPVWNGCSFSQLQSYCTYLGYPYNY
jgi:hypothetical protein